MNKILLITRREYTSRVKKKSFIIMTILGPVLVALFYAGMAYVAISGNLDREIKEIKVVDETGEFIDKIPDSKTLKFIYSSRPFAIEKLELSKSEHQTLLYIPRSFSGGKNDSVEMHSMDQPSLGTKSYIEENLEKVIQNRKLAEKGIQQSTIDSTKTTIEIKTIRDSAISNTIVSTVIGFLCAMLIYVFILIYGVQVMKGVIEEKTNRIVEIVISSVRPFQLMLGKIFGIALVALTQFMIWVILTLTLVTVISAFIGSELNNPEMKNIQQTEQVQQLPDAKTNKVQEVLSALGTVNASLVLGMFLFYFIGGYLFYSALFAAIGAAVDSDTETQQFILPITLPLIFALGVAQAIVINNPDGNLAFWFSMIPFTSPIVMMVRIPFHVPVWELLLSMFFMTAGFIFTTWLAGKIYRTGILLYGKKITYRELAKWLFYKS